jgi:hypothetical protein
MALYLIPRKFKEAYKLDAKNGNTKWQDAMKEEINARLMFITFINHGKIPYLEGYKNIIVHFLTFTMIFITKLILLLAATLQTPIWTAPTLMSPIYELCTLTSL